MMSEAVQLLVKKSRCQGLLKGQRVNPTILKEAFASVDLDTADFEF